MSIRNVLALFVLFLVACTLSVVMASTPSAPTQAEKKPDDPYAWRQLFDGKTLAGWSTPKSGGDGEVSVKDGAIVIGMGAMATGIKYEKVFPKFDYEIRFEAQRTQGHDFFAALTFPYGDSFCTFINGGWGGGTVGLSSVDGYDASENETGDFYSFKDHVWYTFRVQVTQKNISVWISDRAPEADKDGKVTEKRVVDLDTKDRKISLRDETSLFKPLGFCTWVSEGMLRNVEYRKLRPEEIDGKPLEK